MDENVVAIAFSEESTAYERIARLKELAAEDQIGLHGDAVTESRTVEQVQAKLRELCERLGHWVQH